MYFTDVESVNIYSFTYKCRSIRLKEKCLTKFFRFMVAFVLVKNGLLCIEDPKTFMSMLKNLKSIGLYEVYCNVTKSRQACGTLNRSVENCLDCYTRSYLLAFLKL